MTPAVGQAGKTAGTVPAMLLSRLCLPALGTVVLLTRTARWMIRSTAWADRAGWMLPTWRGNVVGPALSTPVLSREVRSV